MLRLLLLVAVSLHSAADAQEKTEPTVEEQRMELMRSRAQAIRFRTESENRPPRMKVDPLFRYDDIPRGYVDGAVWRWGESGRPLAIITTELHPLYLGSGPRVVYDFLSLSETPFSATSQDASWQPSGSAVKFQKLREGPKPADTTAKRLFQMKQIIRGFSASQHVTRETPEEKRLKLRLLPRPIDQYQPTGEGTDGACFLFVAGRMPGIIVMLETDGQQWQFGIGRLSAPSNLWVEVGGETVYQEPPDFGSWSSPYNASNSSAKIPGY